MTRLRPVLVVALVSLFALLSPAQARAFCGFFVGGAGASLVNDATQVALLRHGTRTVLSMRNSYQGPPEDFALVIPVPVVLQKENVKTLPVALFDRLDQLTAPRLVEYWEQNPCPEREEVSDFSADNKEGGTGTRAKGEEGSMGAPPRPLVRVEAEFSVDEYDIVVLSADDSTALEVWLRQNHYNLPAGVEPFLRPYIVGGSKFFVARVNAKKVRFLWGRAQLSPLRFHYDTEKFELPIRLGLANASGPQDLIVYVLAGNGQRFEAANYDNLFIPTNLEVKDETRQKYPSFYASLFDRTVAGKPRAVVTEYAWSAGSCDPCPTPPLDEGALAQLGGDVMPAETSFRDAAITRLHARYGRETLGDDLVFRPASPVAGGNEGWGGRGGLAGKVGSSSKGATPSGSNTFQGRYIIRHPWEGPVACADPSFAGWGGPPPGYKAPSPKAGGQFRRDLPIDALILDDVVTTGSTAPRASQPTPPRQYAPRSSLWAAAQRAARRGDGLPLVLLAQLVAVMIVARRVRAGALRHGALFVLLASLPLLAMFFRPTRDVIRDLHFPPLFFAGSGLFLMELLMMQAASRARWRFPAWVMALMALGPLSFGLLDQAGTNRVIAGALAEPGVDAFQRARVLAEGEGESLGGLLTAGYEAALMLLALAWWLAGRPRPGAPPPGLRARLAGASALGLLAAAALLGGAGLAGPVRPLAALALAGVVAGAAVAQRLAGRWPSPSRPEPDDSALDALVTLGLAALLLALLPAIAAHQHQLDIVTYDSVDPQQTLRIFQNTSDELRSLALRAPLLVAAALAPLALLLWLRPREAASPRGSWSDAPLASGVVLVAVAAGSLMLRQDLLARHRAPQQLSGRLEAAHHLAPPTPAVPDLAALALGQDRDGGALLGGPLLTVDATGQLAGSPSSAVAPRPFDDALFAAMGKPSEDTDASLVPLLLSDRNLTLGGLRGALAPILGRNQWSFRWLVGDQRAAAGDLGPYADLIDSKPTRLTLDVDLIEHLEVLPAPAEARKAVGRAVLALRADPGREGFFSKIEATGGAGHYTLRPGARAAPLDARSFTRESPDPSRVAVEELVLVAPADATVASLSHQLVQLAAYPLAQLSRHSLVPRRVRIVLTADDALFSR